MNLQRLAQSVRARLSWGWRTVRDTGVNRYQVHPSGERRVVNASTGYQPVDSHWLKTGEWAPPLKTSPACDHGVAYDAEAARGMSVAEVRKAYPRLFGDCPKGCGFHGISYASREHMGDW